VRSRAFKQLNRWEEALETVKQAIQIRTTRNLLKDLEEIEERLGTERLIIKEDSDEDLEYIDDEKKNTKFNDNNNQNKSNTFSGLISFIIRYLKYFSGSLWRKKKYIFLILCIILFLIFKNKIRINFIKYLSIVDK